MTQKSGLAGIKLRPMVLGDIESVVSIERLSFPTPWPWDAFLYELARPQRSITRVAELPGKDGKPNIVGDTVVWLAGRIAHVATLAVHPDYRSRGIGSCLLANALLAALDRGMSESRLEVREENLRAQRLYQQFGFTMVGIRKGYYQDTGEDAVLMSLKPLNHDKLAEFDNCG